LYSATSRGDSNHFGGGDCENFAVNLGFHNLTPLFSSDQPKFIPERQNFQYCLMLGTIRKTDLSWHRILT
jgi:hypothetical protein